MADEKVAGLGRVEGAEMYDSFTEQRVYVGRAVLIVFAMMVLTTVHRLV